MGVGVMLANLIPPPGESAFYCTVVAGGLGLGPLLVLNL